MFRIITDDLGWPGYIVALGLLLMVGAIPAVPVSEAIHAEFLIPGIMLGAGFDCMFLGVIIWEGLSQRAERKAKAAKA